MEIGFFLLGTARPFLWWGGGGGGLFLPIYETRFSKTK